MEQQDSEVAARGTLTGSWQSGTLTFTGAPGPWIVHFTYDGLGRLIRKQSPWPTPDQYGRPQVRTEHFYYDGVRRVQENVTDPIALSGDEEPIKIEDEADLPPLATFTLTLREYVHSPGYVDEVVAQVDVPIAATGADRPAWVIQDANYNLVGLVDDSGQLLHQYTWDPYGQPVAIDRYDTGLNGSPQPFENRIGHQGLFFDRFDGGANNVQMPQLSVDAATGLAAKGLYQNRNRSYSPSLGRFVQRDLYSTAIATLGYRILGQTAQVGAGDISLRGLYSDGCNLHCYARSRPVLHRDPSGLTLGLDLTTTQLLTCGINAVNATFATHAIVGMVRAIQTGTGYQQAALELGFALVGMKGQGGVDLALDAYRVASHKLGRAVSSRIGSTGTLGEGILAKLGGRSQVHFATSRTSRFVDQLVGTTAHESKVGRVALTKDVKEQVLKDAELLSTGQVSEYYWHFVTSPKTGLIGPTAPLEAMLNKYGIRIVFHP